MKPSSLNITRYKPRTERRWQIDQHGSRDAMLYEEDGIVEVYSFPGDGRTAPFTSLTMWIDPHVYHARLPRHYHDRWIRRLARDFAWQCGRRAEQGAS